MTDKLQSIKAAVGAYYALLNEAVHVASELGIYMDAAYDNALTLGVDYDTVTIGFPSNDSYDPGMGWQDTVSFPVAMLVAEGDERAALIAQYHADAKAAEEASSRTYQLKREAEEREAYERLKAKFGAAAQ